MNTTLNTIGYALAVCGSIGFLWLLPRMIWGIFTLDVTQPYELDDEPIGVWCEVVQMDTDTDRVIKRDPRYISFSREQFMHKDFDEFGVPDELVYFYLENKYMDYLTGTELHDNEFVHGIYRWVYNAGEYFPDMNK